MSRKKREKAAARQPLENRSCHGFYRTHKRDNLTGYQANRAERGARTPISANSITIFRLIVNIKNKM